MADDAAPQDETAGFGGPSSERGYRGGPDRRKNPPTLPWLVEWTLLAWIRTSVALMAFGGLLVRFGFFGVAADRASSTLVGLVMLALGGLLCVAAVVRYQAAIRAFNRGEKVRPSTSLPSAVGLVIAGAAVFLIASLWPTLHR